MITAPLCNDFCGKTQHNERVKNYHLRFDAAKSQGLLSEPMKRIQSTSQLELLESGSKKTVDFGFCILLKHFLLRHIYKLK